jgi:hypothetical protein
MSSNGLDLIRIPIKPVNQLGNQWTGSPTPVTFLNKGTYNITYNCAIQPSVGTMSNCYGIITTTALYGGVGYKEILASVKTGAMGTGSGVTPLGFSIQNNIIIQNDNTPIYLDLSVTISGGAIWGVPLTANYNSHMNYICIVKS